MEILLILFIPIFLIGAFVIMHYSKKLDRMYYEEFNYKEMAIAVNILNWCCFILALYLGTLLGIVLNYRFNLI